MTVRYRQSGIFLELFKIFEHFAGARNTMSYCGRPLGIRRYNANKFIVADAVLGLFSVDFEKGR